MAKYLKSVKFPNSDTTYKIAEGQYNPDSEYAQSGKAVAEALQQYVSNEVYESEVDSIHTLLDNKVDVDSIDQTYSPNSENAQSGKAVAEAVAAQQKEVITKFLNISEYTVTQTDFDEGKTRIEFEFPSGCKAFRLYLAVKAGTGSGSVTFQAHGKYNNAYTQKLYIALPNTIYTTDRWARINAEADNGDSYYTFCGPASNNNSSAVASFSTIIKANEPVDVLYLKDGYARIWVTGSVPFPVGSKITVLWR